MRTFFSVTGILLAAIIFSSTSHAQELRVGQSFKVPNGKDNMVSPVGSNILCLVAAGGEISITAFDSESVEFTYQAMNRGSPTGTCSLGKKKGEKFVLQRAKFFSFLLSTTALTASQQEHAWGELTTDRTGKPEQVSNKQ